MKTPRWDIRDREKLRDFEATALRTWLEHNSATMAELIEELDRGDPNL
jgi:hypothetical protein